MVTELGNYSYLNHFFLSVYFAFNFTVRNNNNIIIITYLNYRYANIYVSTTSQQQNLINSCHR